MAWSLAPALVQMRAEADQIAPRRSRVSDGTIGDQAHSSRVSQHNPDQWGIVRALDLTHDPRGGWDAHARVEQLRQHRDPRIRYIISNDRIAGPGSAGGGWAWKPYRPGDKKRNQHRQHAHVSIGASMDTARDRRQWWYSDPPPVGPVGRSILITRHHLNGDSVARIVVEVATDSNGNGETGPDEGLHVAYGSVLSVSSHAPHSANYGDGDYLLAPAGHHEARGELVVEVIGGPPGALVYPIVLTDD